MIAAVLRNSALTVFAVVILYGLIAIWDMNLRDPRYLDGWLLAGFMLVQLSYHVRRGWFGRSIAPAARWMQFHSYTGYLVIALFLLHTQYRLPDSSIEWILWLLFAITSLSGVVGSYFSTTIPAKLELQREGIEFDAIPEARQRLAEEAAALAEKAAEDTASRAIAEIYVSTLHDYFARPRNLVQHMRHSPWPLRRLSQKLEAVERYVGASGQESLQRMRQLTAAKSFLDFQFAQQLVLQAWLFIHVPATYGLIVASVFHVAQIYAFSTGIP